MDEAAQFDITLVTEDGQTLHCKCRADTCIAAAFEAAGFRMRLACRSGGCGACVAWLQEGHVQHQQTVSRARLDAFPRTLGQPVFLCRASPRSPVRVQVAGVPVRRILSPLSNALNASSSRTDG